MFDLVVFVCALGITLCLDALVIFIAGMAIVSAFADKFKRKFRR